MAVVITSGWVSHSRVEPSTSANSNVTVPVGNNPLTSSSLQSIRGVSARGSISLMLASMRPPQTAKHQRKRADFGPTAYTTPAGADLRAAADVLSLLAPDIRVRPLD